MQLGYYPGCTLSKHATAKEFGGAIQAVADAVQIELVELPDWNCCGATAAHATDPVLAVTLPGRNLVLAEEAGFEKLVAPCAACSSRLLAAHQALLHPESHPGARSAPFRYAGGVEIVNGISFVLDYVLPRLPETARISPSVPIACYYGCLLLRPPKVVQFDDAEQPRSMENVVERLGGKTVSWAFRTECCGGGFSMSFTDLVLEMTKAVLLDAKANGAEAIAVSCPMCHSNLDMRQRQIEKRIGKKIDLPIFYLPQLVGLALGIDFKTLDFKGHFVDPTPVAEKLVAHL